MINGRWDSAEKVWIYGETDHDFGNIIALKKGTYHVESTGDFSFYYLNEAEKAYAGECAIYYDEIKKVRFLRIIYQR